MLAAVYHGPGRVSLEDVAAPRAGRGRMVIRVLAATVFGTDVKTWRQGHPLITPPVILGHEFAGVVEQADEVPGFAAGDVVTAAPYVECGRCFLCRHGAPELCEHKEFPSNGAFTEFVAVSRRFARRGVARVAPGLAVEAGAFVEPLACVVNGLDEIRVRPGEVVAVVGGGPMGLLHVLALGGSRVLVSEPEPARRAMAARLGAEVCEPAAARDRILARTEGRGADAVIVAVGDPSVAAASLRLARKGGRVLWFGGFPRDAAATIDPNLVHYGQIAVHGTFGFSSRHFRRAAAMLAGGLDPTPLVTHRLPLAEAVAALELAGSRNAIKVALVMR